MFMRGDFYEKTICFFLDLSECQRVSNLKLEDSGKVLSVAYLKPGLYARLLELHVDGPWAKCQTAHKSRLDAVKQKSSHFFIIFVYFT